MRPYLAENQETTAEVYGTEEIVGEAVKSYDRDKLMLWIKMPFKTDDTADRLPRAKDNEVIDFGDRRVRRLDIPHVPHNSDASLIYDGTTGMLFSGNVG